MGASKAQKEYNRQMAELSRQQLELQKRMFERASEDTPEQRRFREGAAAWDKFIAGKDYRTPPPTSSINFDLFNPAYIQQQKERMSDITGIGAAALSGTGNESIALQLARERNANEAAQMAGQAYENAIKSEDAYYKGQNLGYAQLGLNQNFGLLSNATDMFQYANRMQAQTLPPSFWQTFGPLFGGLLNTAASVFMPQMSFGRASGTSSASRAAGTMSPHSPR